MRVPLNPVEVAPSPWRNGAGSTRELHHVTDEAGATLWRISVADLDTDAVFSAFPGLERLFLPLGPVRLVIGGSEVELAAYQTTRFPGEAAVEVRLSEPTRALNVMTRQGCFTADVHLVDNETADVEIRELSQ